MTAPSTTITPGADQPVATTLPVEWRDEATIAVNPADPSIVIAASSKYTLMPSIRSLSVHYSRDGGRSWSPAVLPLIAGQATAGAGLTNPLLAFGAEGAAYLLVLGSDAGLVIGPHTLRSGDGGATWEATTPERSVDAPASLTWFACDPKHPGRLYMTAGGLRRIGEPSGGAGFLRSDDYGRSWTETLLPRVPGGAGPTLDLNLGWAPHVAIDAHGTIHVMSIAGRAFVLTHWRSGDGGKSFTVQPVTGPLTLSPISVGSLHVSACVVNERRLVAAWAAMHDGASRIYYRVTDDAGVNWLGPAGGTPLLPSLPIRPVVPATGTVSRFRPQLSVTGNGVVGCAFYELREGSGLQRVQLMLAASFTGGDDFEQSLAISDTSWDTASGAAAGLSADQQLGHYFGLAADANSFLALWPDTRTGAQTLYFDRARIEWGPTPFVPSDHITVDLRMDGRNSGWVIVVKRGGKVIFTGKVPGPAVPGGPGPRPGPALELVRALSAPAASGDFDAAQRVHEGGAAQALGSALREIAAALLEGAALDEHRDGEERPNPRR
jgi:hypothetical protein